MAHYFLSIMAMIHILFKGQPFHAECMLYSAIKLNVNSF